MYNFNNLEFIGPSRDRTANWLSSISSPGVKTSPALWLSKIRSASKLSLSGFGVSVIMKKMSNLEILDLIDRLQKSEAVNYLESRERLFLSNMSEKIRIQLDITLDDTHIQSLNVIFKKYLRYTE